MIRDLVLMLVVLSATGCSGMSAQDRETVALRFWAGPGAKTDPRVLEVSPHCCCAGEIALARVSQLPLPGARGSLMTEVAVELSEAGVVLRRWPLPADLIVTGIDTDHLLVSLAPMGSGNFGRGVLISPHGVLSVTTVPKESPEPKQYTCPELPVFGGSGYLRCFEFLDLESGAVRCLAYEPPCT